MVLESLMSPTKAERRPWEMLPVGFLYASVAVLFALWVFPRMAGLVAVFLTVLACGPLMYNTIRKEEKRDVTEDVREKVLLKEHARALSFFVFLFFGITIAFIVWYVLLPSGVAQNLFGLQAQTITAINNQVTGNAASQTLFFKIFFNNIKVLAFCLIFSFFYGAGAIFILTWNASVIATAVGTFIREGIAKYAAFAGMAKGVIYFQIFSLGLLRYSVHGVPEIAAYFVAGLAGGIISVAVIRHDFRSKKFHHVVADSADLILLSVLILFVAALIEVFITPALF